MKTTVILLCPLKSIIMYKEKSIIKLYLLSSTKHMYNKTNKYINNDKLII